MVLEYEKVTIKRGYTLTFIHNFPAPQASETGLTDEQQSSLTSIYERDKMRGSLIQIDLVGIKLVKTWI